MSAATEKTGAIWFIDNLARIRVTGEESDGRLALVELAGRRGHMPPLHVHQREDEAFVVLEGEIEFHMGGASRRVAAGEVAFGPRGVPHTFRVESDTARWLAVCAPSGFERFVTEVGEPAPEPVVPAEPVLPSPERLTEIAGGFGIEILGPPGALPS